MLQPRNPFILGHRIHRPYFCDREEEQRSLSAAVTNGRNVVLISPRRMGKTSLIYVTLHDSETIKEEYLTFFFDILQTNSLKEFTYLLGKAIFDTLASKSVAKVRGFLAALKSLKGTFGFDPISGLPNFDIQLGDISHPEYTLNEIFDYIEQSEKPIVVVIDEFQQITKYPENNTEAILRSHMQRLTNATFIFAGSEQTLLQEMFLSSKRPFYNSSEIMHLGPISENIYTDFVVYHFEQRKKNIDKEAIKLVFNLFEGNTFYLQRTLNGAYAETPEGATCTCDTAIHAINAMLLSNEVIYRELLSNISISQKALLYAIAKVHMIPRPTSGAFIKAHSLPSASSVQSALLKLQHQGLVTKSPQGYHLTDPLLRIFINNLYSTPEF